MRVTNPKSQQVLVSPFESNALAADCLKERVNKGEWGAGHDEFPCSLLQAAHKAGKPGARWPLSPAREFWLHKLATEGNTRNKPQEPTADLDLSGVRKMFEVAGSKLKHPALHLREPASGVEFKVYPAGPRSKYYGSLLVVSPVYGDAYYGRVTDGQFYSGGSCSQDMVKFLKMLEAHPEETARAQGTLTGRCCFCRRKLDDEASAEIGYGPTCAKNYGLKHSYSTNVAHRIREAAAA